MAHTSWQKRIRRAGVLAEQHRFAAEILEFYKQLATFQERLSTRFEASADRRSFSPAELPEPATLLEAIPGFLSMIEGKAPARFAQVAHTLRVGSSGSWQALLGECWAHPDRQPENAEEFLAVAFLQPYAEVIRLKAQLKLAGYTYSVCPFCSRKPGFGALRQLGDGGQRNLVCGFCLCEWEFRRIVCAGCGQEDQAKLPIYTAEQFPHVRVECCDSCHTYIKSVDLTKNGLADPLVDELAAVPLDLWAQEHGYVKLRPNLLGM